MHWPLAFDLLCADFNFLTLLRPEALLRAIKMARPSSFIFTDVACSKLHLNYRRYGLERPDLNDYFAAFGERLPGWKLVHVARKHHNAATTAWRR